MEKVKTGYCRFCAEPKCPEKMMDFSKDEVQFNLILSKLDFLNAMYVDVSSKNNILPKTVCFICYESFNKAYEFLTKVKDAQSILSNIFPINQDEYDISDDDNIMGLDSSMSYLNTVTEDSDVKQEDQIEKKPDNSLEVKKEPKEELLPANETFSVQNLLDAAFNNDNTYSGLPVYVNEELEVEPKTIVKWKEYPWICAHCNIEFLDIGTLRMHSKITHGKCNAYVCVDCKDCFGASDYEFFVEHVRWHRRKLGKRCQYCDEHVKDDMSSHVQTHFQRYQVACNLCGEIFKNSEALQKHLDEFTVTKRTRKPRRKRGTPLTIADLTCNLCKKVYKNPNSLRDHMKIHTNDRTRNYTCDRCGKMFYNKGTLTSHIMAHDQIRPHICRICNKSFLFPNMLRRHVEMHSGIKPFSCEQCGRCFRLQYQLNAHKIIHTDSMPHVCQYCSKAFRFKQILKNHERQHTGSKPYSCQNCGMEFTNWSNYNKHMKRRHNLDTSKKKITPEGVFPINPQTGQLVQLNDASTEEWKTKIMIPGKRGKKKAIKKEDP